MLRITLAPAETKDYFRSHHNLQRSKEMLVRKLNGETFENIATFFNISSQFVQADIKKTCVFLLGESVEDESPAKIIKIFHSKLTELSKNL